MEPPKTDILTRRHQKTASVVLAICLTLLAISWGREYVRRGQRINIDRAYEVRAVETKIDPNVADWPELTLLPDISETMARRIVEHRKLNGRFETVEELTRVKGIGPRTFARIEPYLSLIAPVNATVQRSDATAGSVTE